MVLIAAWVITAGLGATAVAGFACCLTEPNRRLNLAFFGLLLGGLAAAG